MFSCTKLFSQFTLQMSWPISVNTIIPKVSKSRSVRTLIRPSCITRKRAGPVRRRDAVVRVHASKQRLLSVDDVGLGAASGAVHRWTPVGRDGWLVGTVMVSSGAVVQTPGALAELFGFTLGSAHGLGLQRDSPSADAFTQNTFQYTYY